MKFLATLAASKKPGEQVIVANIPMLMSPVLVGLKKVLRLLKESVVNSRFPGGLDFFAVSCAFVDRPHPNVGLVGEHGVNLGRGDSS